MINKNRLAAIIGFLIFGALSLFLMKLSGLTAAFLDDSFSQAISGAMENSAMLDYGYLIAGILMLPVAFAFVGVYSLMQEKADWILAASGIAMILLSLIFIGASITGAAFGLGLAASNFLIQYLSIDDAKAYKELRPSRIIRGAASSAILLISILVAISVFFAVSDNASYADNGINSMVDTIIKITVSESGKLSLEEIPGATEMLSEQIKSSELMAILRAYYPQMSAITAFTAIQVLGILIAPLAGIYAWILWRMNGLGGKAYVKEIAARV